METTGQSLRRDRRGVTRRGLLAAMGAGAFAGAVPAGGREQPVDRWPLFQYDPANSGHAPRLKGPREAAGARWGYRDGESFGTTPVVTGDVVYVADGGAGAVTALDRNDGHERWRVDAALDGARMTVAGGSLLVPGDSLRALDPADGSEQWSLRVGRPESVLVRNGYAYVAARGGIYRVAIEGRAVDWQNDRITPLQPALAVTGEYVYGAGTQYGSVIALDPANGSRRWLRRIGSPARGAPTAASDRVVVPGEDALVALSFESGIERWRHEVRVRSSVAVADGTVFATAEGEDVVAVDAESGEQRWRRSVVPGSNPPVVVGGLLYVTGTDGTVAALSPSDGSVVWRATVGGEHAAGVAAAGGELYVADREGQVAALAAGASGGFRTATPTPTAADGDDEATDAADDDVGTDGATPTSTEAPGLGVASGALASGLGALATRRWLGGDD